MMTATRLIISTSNVGNCSFKLDCAFHFGLQKIAFVPHVFFGFCILFGFVDMDYIFGTNIRQNYRYSDKCKLTRLTLAQEKNDC